MRGSADGESLSIAWCPHGDYHSHLDSLRITYRARGRDLFPDLHTNYASPFRTLWTDRTLAHATVSVNGQRQAQSRGGALHAFARHHHSVMLRVSDHSVYPDLDSYERRLVKVEDGGAPYIVDAFYLDFSQSSLEAELEAEFYLFEDDLRDTGTIPMGYTSTSVGVRYYF